MGGSAAPWNGVRAPTAGPHGECVELAVSGGVLCVRDSKAPDGPVPPLARAGRTALAAAVRGFIEH
ncbi:DUF397 domain-containing protein [Actinomadura rubrisoli]|uniref:DUF397 domain-containing protein n=1 Tax=Actinomadura rubrisoli TaxID=2530368 RepID=UPI0026C8B863